MKCIALALVAIVLGLTAGCSKGFGKYYTARKSNFILYNDPQLMKSCRDRADLVLGILIENNCRIPDYRGKMPDVLITPWIYPAESPGDFFQEYSIEWEKVNMRISLIDARISYHKSDEENNHARPQANDTSTSNTVMELLNSHDSDMTTDTLDTDKSDMTTETIHNKSLKILQCLLPLKWQSYQLFYSMHEPKDHRYRCWFRRKINGMEMDDSASFTFDDQTGELRQMDIWCIPACFPCMQDVRFSEKKAEAKAKRYIGFAYGVFSEKMVISHMLRITYNNIDGNPSNIPIHDYSNPRLAHQIVIHTKNRHNTWHSDTLLVDAIDGHIIVHSHAGYIW